MGTDGAAALAGPTKHAVHKRRSTAMSTDHLRTASSSVGNTSTQQQLKRVIKQQPAPTRLLFNSGQYSRV